MKIVINDNIVNIKLCNNFFSKLKGIMFVKKKLNYGLCFKRTSSIHTFFCFQNIDVIICDKMNNVLYTYKNLKPWKIIWPKKKAYYIYEFSTGLVNIDNIKKIKVV